MLRKAIFVFVLAALLAGCASHVTPVTPPGPNPIVSLKIIAGEPDETEFNIYRNGVEIGTALASSPPSGTVDYIDANTPIGTLTYTVRAVVDGVLSDPSIPAVITTKVPVTLRISIAHK